MHPTAATATVLIFLAALATLVYLASCWATPYRRCRHCHGAGRITAPARHRYRHCRHCDDTGLRLRTGRRLWNYLRHHAR